MNEHFFENSQQDLQDVQADEIKVKTQKGTYWMALALAVRTRLWLGSVISGNRDLEVIQAWWTKSGRLHYVILYFWL